MQKEKVLYRATLCFPIRGNEVLLSLKTKNIGEGYLNGYGGGIKRGETVKEAALRELKEEVGITASLKHLRKVAIIDFHNTQSDGVSFVSRVHVFLAYLWTGEPRSSNEMITPALYDIDNLPEKKMMLADRYWLPLVLKGKKIVAKASYGPFQRTLFGKVEIKEVGSFPEE